MFFPSKSDKNSTHWKQKYWFGTFTLSSVKQVIINDRIRKLKIHQFYERVHVPSCTLNMVWGILSNAFDKSRIIYLSFSNQSYTFSNHYRFGESRLAPAGPEGRTINIEVHSVDICSDKRLWVYDFGGHETYHFSQQLFLSKQALYVITIDITTYRPTEFDTRLCHWYNMVTSRVVAPIICVVATHIDESASEDDVSAKCRDIEEKLKQLEYEVRNENTGL